MKCAFTCFFILVFLLSNAEKTKIDSLIINFNKAVHDTSRIDIYLEIGNFYEDSQQDTAVVYFEKALDLAQKNITKHPRFKVRQSIALRYIGVVLEYQGKYDKAIEYFLKALKIDESLYDKKGMAMGYINIGNVYKEQGSFNKAIEYYNNALKMAEELGGKKAMSTCYNNIGNAYKRLGNIDLAIEYFLKSLKIDEESGDQKGVSYCYNNLGNAYLRKHDFDKSLKCYLKAIDIFDKLNDRADKAAVLGNIASLHIRIADSVAISAQEKREHYNLAVKYGMQGFRIANDLKVLPWINGIASYLQNANKGLGNSAKALEFAEIYIATKDSMFQEEKTKAITEMETKYQSEKKQLEIDKLAKEKELQTSEMKKQRLIILFVVCGLLFILGFAVVLFRMFIQKKKANKIITEKNEALQLAYEEINTQKEEIIVQRDSIQEQKEIIEEHQKEIEDSINYARRIQKAVMPSLEIIIDNQYSVNGDALSLSKCNQSTEYRIPKPEYFVLFRPKDIVSGDFYWSTRIDEMLIITVADCTGHGVPGAFMSMLGISFLNEIVRKKEITKASEVLDELRTSVIDALKQKGDSGEQKDGMDIALCAINMNTLEMQFSGANNPVWIIRPVSSSSPTKEGVSRTELNTSRYVRESELLEATSELIEIKGDKMPIGIHSHMQPFTNQKYQLQQGDTIYLMSDGYEDQFGGPNRKKFLSKNLKQLLIANSQQRCIEPACPDNLSRFIGKSVVEMPMAVQKQILETTINEWIGNKEQIDDITVFGIRMYT